MDHLRLSTPPPIDSLWLRPIAMPAATAQMILLPYAGGGAHAFVDWAPALPAEVALAAVEYPGHGARIAEEPIEDPTVMIAEVAGLLTGVRERLEGRPLIIGGHSLGAVLAHAVAATMQADGQPVDGLLLSGALPAHRASAVPDLSGLSDDALAAALGAEGDIPAEILEDAEARAFYLPLVRRGLVFARRLCSVVTAGALLRTPVHAATAVVSGDDDIRCPVDGVEAWAEVVDGPLKITVLPGGHFFYRGQLEAMGRVITGLVGHTRRRVAR